MNIKFLKQSIKAGMASKEFPMQYREYYTRWKESLEPGHNSIADRQPWITFPSIDLLKDKLDQRSKVFEYGGGGSTLFFLDHAGEVVTVEHDGEWFYKLEAIIRSDNDSSLKWKGHFIKPEALAPGVHPDVSNPDDYFSADVNFQKATFKNYAGKIDEFTNDYFDVVLVDGRVRPSCIKHAIPKLKKGGWLVVDNSDRDYYFTHFTDQFKRSFKLIYNKWNVVPYLESFSKTGIWEKQN